MASWTDGLGRLYFWVVVPSMWVDGLGWTHHAIGRTDGFFGVLFAQVHTCIDGVDIWVDMGGWADMSHVWADTAPCY
jgi:hypothetical protein